MQFFWSQIVRFKDIEGAGWGRWGEGVAVSESASKSHRSLVWLLLRSLPTRLSDDVLSVSNSGGVSARWRSCFVML